MLLRAMAKNLFFMTAFATTISLATADAVQDPYLIWVVGVPSVVGPIAAFVFYWLFRDIDQDFLVDVLDVSALLRKGTNDLEMSSSLGEKKAVGAHSQEFATLPTCQKLLARMENMKRVLVQIWYLRSCHYDRACHDRWLTYQANVSLQ
jgi:hypothetical protein